MENAGALRVEVGAGPGEGAVTVLLVLGGYWRADRDERTELGDLVRRAKDRGDPCAAADLAERFASLAASLPEPVGGLPRLVAPVPPGDGGRADLAAVLASSLAAAGAGEYRPTLVVKTNPTARMRHLEPGRRAAAAASAGYRASEPVAGRHIVVVDDVVLTGATLNAVAACLHDAGAASVTAAVATRTRRCRGRP